MTGIQIALLGLTGLVTALTLAPLSNSTKWWIRVWEFPRLQLALLSLALFAVLIILSGFTPPWSFGLLGITGICVLRQVSQILPYTPIWRPEVAQSKSSDSDERVRILTANVEMTNRQSDALMELIDEYDPDIVLTVETDDWWGNELRSVEEKRPHSLKCPRSNTYGMHLFSRLPVSESKIHFLVEEDVPSMHLTVTMPGDKKVRLYCVHPAPPSPTENAESTERDIELDLIARICAESDGPIIVTGDLNDVAWSRTTRRFRDVSGLLDPRIGRGLFNTFHAKLPIVRWPLDHFFHSDHFSLVSMRRLPKFGSDHFPILIDLQLK